jgi:hypothetical protein
MATTPNYGFIMPDPTDFVTDLPADFEIFGDEVDLRIKALNPETTAGDIAYRGATANAKDRLAIGTAGQVLSVNSGATAPEWVSVSSGGMTQITTGTLSGASVSLTSIPGTYKNLQLVIRNFLPANDGVTMRIQFNSDTASNYENAANNQAVQTGASFNGTSHTISSPQDNAVSESILFFELYDYANTATWKAGEGFNLANNQTDATNFNATRYHTWYRSISAISSMQLTCSTGNFTSGTYILYGVS